jgi:hypothetical protein
MKNIDKSICHEDKIVTLSNQRDKSGFLSIISTILLIILPKCPFCIAAYSSALLLFFDIDNVTLIPFLTHLKPFLGTLIWVSIILNYKKEKSPLAITLASIALIALLFNVYWNIFFVSNNYIYLVFLFAAWFNGNFKSFYYYLRDKLIKI